MIRTAAASLAVFAAAVASGPASATLVTPTDMQGWGIYTYGSSSPAPSGAITGDHPHLGNGSAVINLYDQGATEVLWWYELATATSMSQLNKLSFDWYVSSTSTTPNWTTPAFALYVTSANASGYLIWEGAYNGTGSGAAQDTWVSSDILGDKFWWNPTGANGGCANAANYEDLSWFDTNCFGGTAQVVALAPFLGFGYAGTEFHGAFDNVAYGFERGASDTFNFEVRAEAVPEPATLALLGLAIAGLGVSRRQKRKS